MSCPYCSEEALWVENKEVYGRNYGKSYMIWLCKPCDAYVGCHNNTKEPLGTLANKELREWRKKAHEAIDDYWKSEIYTRKEVYQKLKEHFGNEIHIGEADMALCKDLATGADHILEGEIF